MTARHLAGPLVPFLALGAAAACCAAAMAQGSRAADDAAEAAAGRIASLKKQVDDAYLLGPAAADALGCRILWQANLPIPTNETLARVWSTPDSVMALNSRNELHRLRAATGDRMWCTSVAQRIDWVQGVRRIDAPSDLMEDRIAVCADTVIYLIDAANGATLQRHPLRMHPGTHAVFAEGFAIFGSRSGAVVWVDGHTGFVRRGITLDPIAEDASAILAAPCADDDVVVAASTKGTVGAFGVAAGSSYWRRELLGGVVAQPAVANGIAFVASEDQYLYAFDLGTGATLWKYFTQSPLTSAPFAAGELVLQSIPTEGLVAFTQSPEGQLAGEVRWTRPLGDGEPLTTMTYRDREAVVYWSAKNRRLTFVGLEKGQTLGTLDVPSVENIVANTMEPGGFLVWGADGRVERLTPVKAKPAAASDTAPAAPEAEAAATTPELNG